MDEVMRPEELENFEDLDAMEDSLSSLAGESTDDLLDTLEMPVFRLPTMQDAAEPDPAEDQDDPDEADTPDPDEDQEARPLPLSGILRRSRLVRARQDMASEPIPDAWLLPHLVQQHWPLLELQWREGLPEALRQQLEPGAQEPPLAAPAPEAKPDSAQELDQGLDEVPTSEEIPAPRERTASEENPALQDPPTPQEGPTQPSPRASRDSRGEATQEIDLAEVQLALEEAEELREEAGAAPSRPPKIPAPPKVPSNGARPKRPPSMPAIPSQARQPGAKPGHGPTPPPRPALKANPKGPPTLAPPKNGKPAKKNDIQGLVQELLDEETPASRPGDPTSELMPPRRSWYEEIFNEEYFRTLPMGFHKQTRREAQFIQDCLGVGPGGRILDLSCGFGRHTIELAKRGYDMVGLDLSLPLLQKALNEAQRRNLSIKFIHGDLRELNFTAVFDAIYNYHTSFGYFDDKTNFDVLCGVHRALKNGGRFLMEMVNRDLIVQMMPRRKWWEGSDCIFLEEIDFNFKTSVLHTKRSFIYDDGRPPWEQNIYIRLFSLHELRNLLQHAGFHILEVSGDIASRGAFFGNTSRHIILLAEKRLSS